MNPTATPKTDGRHVDPAAQRELRARCVASLQAGVKQAQIARNLGQTRAWVSKIAKRLSELGEEVAIAGQRRGISQKASTERRWLNEAQLKELGKLIVDQTPWQLKLDFALWTTKAVKQLISSKFGMDIPERTVRQYLKRMGMSPQRPKKVALQQDAEAVREWLEETYPKIEKRAKEEKATIFWQDETSVQQDTNWVRGYAPVGQTPIIKENRRSCYGAPVMISAVNNQGLCLFMFQKKAATRFSFIRFLHRLILAHKQEVRKLFVICDNAKFHHAKLVQAYVQRHADEIELFFLPAYSPDRNPDEFLNRALKTELRLKPPMDHDQTQAHAEAVMARFQKEREPIVKCFDHETVQYARAN